MEFHGNTERPVEFQCNTRQHFPLPMEFNWNTGDDMPMTHNSSGIMVTIFQWNSSGISVTIFQWNTSENIPVTIIVSNQNDI